MPEITLSDESNLNDMKNCIHNFILQANIKIEGIIWDVYYCSKCLTHVKKERPCPIHLDRIV